MAVGLRSWGRRRRPGGTCRSPPRAPSCRGQFGDPGGPGDRKSTRLNSSHANISYAVFCLKKKRRATTKLACPERIVAVPSTALPLRNWTVPVGVAFRKVTVSVVEAPELASIRDAVKTIAPLERTMVLAKTAEVLLVLFRSPEYTATKLSFFF